MAEKKLTDKQLYKAKVQWFKDHEYEEVKPLDFYREVFPVGSFQEVGEYNERRGNGCLIYATEDGHHRHRMIFDDLAEITQWLGKPNVIIRALSYRGKWNARNENACMYYAMVFDLDGQDLKHMENTLYQADNDVIPMPTYVVLSGHGLHLYYVLDTPIRADIETIRKLNNVKQYLTRNIWNRYNSYIEKPQYQPATQGFRMVGSASKLGARYPLRAFRTGEKWNIQDLADRIPNFREYDQLRVSFDISDRSRVPLAKAKELWPEWYKRRIEDGEPSKWHIKRDLYDWWLGKIKTDASYGHRYFAVLCLAIFAIKCDISEDELKRDAYSLVDDLTEINKKEPFTRDDVTAALRGYNQALKNYGRDKMALISAITMPANKRNYRKQEEHMRVMSAIRDVLYPNGSWREGNGRPKGSANKYYPKAEIIKKWRMDHPTGKKIDCHRDTGITRPTIDKWWDVE